MCLIYLYMFGTGISAAGVGRGAVRLLYAGIFIIVVLLSHITVSRLMSWIGCESRP